MTIRTIPLPPDDSPPRDACDPSGRSLHRHTSKQHNTVRTRWRQTTQHNKEQHSHLIASEEWSAVGNTARRGKKKIFE